ncbi:acetyl-CoA carboxylase, biotin carboxylase subunit [Clostridium collagenovorans DSM 3089]|uniref:Biotin carboxylase n=1 Tax=Clostridium collagenovorans DSM 3089 TaxID=1121306 RepID=A0A1M5X967_9CLOT|nr:acetyl-CoA carboxylase biotin carboxylase subunit [Clostridium collagenovorans]SHH96370.1 acetyl-CoA carboxylase, biotin carboxylase subunit [Clostridium collagenovorans DSM 3089]
MLKKVLIANRGEIAVRVIRACRELGIRTVAIYSEADKEALHTQLADESVCVGGPQSKDSYLNIKNILSAAILTGAEGIHPGFGFLSENSKFAQMCKECNIIFIGPDAETIDAMGNKSKAKEIMDAAGVPIIRGSKGIVETEEEAIELCKTIGYPIMIKASAGGGGRGIRIVREEKDLVSSYTMAKTEAKIAFGDDSMYIEKFIEEPRHIEVQVLGDNYGNVLYLGERDCSIQRRNQKVIEEAPSCVIDEETRKKLGDIAVKAAKAVNYKGAGTIEFLRDKYGEFYFMEMNTRIQVEHPVTEMITGIDIVKEQLNVASNKPLDIKQEDITINGHAIECRINAEDPRAGFMPSPGVVNVINLPGGFGVRLDTAIYNGYKIPPYYDSMVAKLIVHGRDREEAINKMKRALDEFIIEGVKNNIEFQYEILNNKKFNEGDINTSFIAQEFGM